MSKYCTCSVDCSCLLLEQPFFGCIYCNNVLYLLRWSFPPLYLLMFFLHLPTVHTFSTYIYCTFSVDLPTSLFCSCFFCIYLLYILNTVRALLIVPASLFAHVFLNLPTVHTYSTYILCVLCWSFPITLEYSYLFSFFFLFSFCMLTSHIGVVITTRPVALSCVLLLRSLVARSVHA